MILSRLCTRTILSPNLESAEKFLNFLSEKHINYSFSLETVLCFKDRVGHTFVNFFF